MPSVKESPLQTHSCTDIICLAIFVFSIGCWVILIAIAFHVGDPESLLRPTDTEGQKCGVDERVKDKPFLFFFNILKCVSPKSLVLGCATPQVCVKECPTENLVAVPSTGNKTYEEDTMKKLICKYDYPQNDSFSDLIYDGHCAFWYLPSKAIGGRCIPILKKEQVEHILNAISEIGSFNLTDLDGNPVGVDTFFDASKTLGRLARARETGAKTVGDIKKSWKMIVLFLVLAVFLSIIYICLLKCVACILVWFTIIAVFLGLFASTAYCAFQYLTTEEVEGSERESDKAFIKNYIGDNLKTIWLILSLTSSVILFILLIVFSCVRKSIRISIALMKESGKAFNSLSVLLPLLTSVVQIGVLALGLSVAVYISSAGDKVHQVQIVPSNCTDCIVHSSSRSASLCDYEVGNYCNLRKFRRDDQDKCPGMSCIFTRYVTKKEMLIMHFCNAAAMIWCFCILSAFCEMSLAGSFATWYWTMDKSDVPQCVLLPSVWRSVRYHVGTLAFGSFLITLAWILRFSLALFVYATDRISKRWKKAEYIVSMLYCIIAFYEKIVRFINRNVYTVCAIKGTNFCRSLKQLAVLIPGQVTTRFLLVFVTFVIAFFGKLIVVILIAYLWIQFSHMIDTHATEYIDLLDGKLAYPWLPIVILIFTSFYIADLFLNLYEMAVYTNFICFLEDCNVNDGSPEKPYYMTDNLKEIMDIKVEKKEDIMDVKVEKKKEENTGSQKGSISSNESETN